MLTLGNGFLSRITSKLLKKIVKKKLGIDADISIDECRFGEAPDNENVILSAKFMIKMKKSDLEKLVDKI